MNFATLPLWFFVTLGTSLVVCLGIIAFAFSLYYRRNHRKTIPPALLTQPPEQSTPPAAGATPARPSIIRQALKLPTSEKLQLKDFRLLTEQIARRTGELHDKYLPFFIWPAGGQIKRLYVYHEADESLDALYEYWQADYRNPEFALLLACYSEATGKSNLARFLIQLAAYKKISAGQLNWLHFLFQDCLNLQKSPEELSPTGDSALDFSLKIAQQKTPVSRREYQQLCLTRLVPDASEFLAALQAAATLPLALYLYHQEHTDTHIREIFFRQFVKSGHLHYPELWLRGNLHPALKIPQTPKEAEELTHELLRHSREGRLLAFLILRHAKCPKELYECLEPDASDVEYLQTIKTTLSDRLRQAAFLYLSEAGYHAAAEDFFPQSIPGKKLPAVRLYQARNWYRLGKYKEAHELIEDLLRDYPENLPVINEAAIYNFKLGNLERAEELFTQMKEMFPESPEIRYNEALFFEYKSLGEIKQRWEQAEGTRKPA